MGAVEAEEPSAQERARQRDAPDHVPVRDRIGEEGMDVEHRDAGSLADLRDGLVVLSDALADGRHLPEIEDHLVGQGPARAPERHGDAVALEQQRRRREGDEGVRGQRSIRTDERHRLTVHAHGRSGRGADDDGLDRVRERDRGHVGEVGGDREGAALLDGIHHGLICRPERRHRRERHALDRAAVHDRPQQVVGPDPQRHHRGLQGQSLGERGAAAAQDQVVEPAAALRHAREQVAHLRRRHAEVVVGAGQVQAQRLALLGRLGGDDGRDEGHESQLGRDARLGHQRLLEAAHPRLGGEERGIGPALVRLHQRTVAHARGEAVSEGHVGGEVGLRPRGRGGQDGDEGQDGPAGKTLHPQFPLGRDPRIHNRRTRPA